MLKTIDCKPCLYLRIGLESIMEVTKMTIKEIENILDIPRATIRFYEKEGLINPQREENGYRDYSKDDVEKIKKIVILRKIGMSVNDIADLFDGAKSLPEALEENLQNLKKQMEELQGAMNLSEKMKEVSADIQNLDADQYLNYIDEEEKQGHKFMTIAKDIATTEKKVIASYFSWTDVDGNSYSSWWGILRNAIIAMGLSGVILCLYRGSWNLKNFLDAALGMLCIIAVEGVLSIPLYFLGKKHPWIAKNRTKALVIAALILAVILLILSNIFNI